MPPFDAIPLGTTVDVWLPVEQSGDPHFVTFSELLSVRRYETTGNPSPPIAMAFCCPTSPT